MSGVHLKPVKRNPLPGYKPPLWKTSFGSNFPRTSRSPTCLIVPWDLNASTVTAYCNSHPDFLNEIILSLEEKKLQYLLHIKEKRADRRRVKSIGSVLCERKDLSNPEKQQALSSIKRQTQIYFKHSREHDVSNLLYEAADVLATALLVDWFSLYLPCHRNRDLFEYNAKSGKILFRSIKKGSTVSTAAALRGQTLLIESLSVDKNYSKGIGHVGADAERVISIPLILPTEYLIGVTELCREKSKMPFSKFDHLVCNWLLGWMVSSLHQAEKNKVLDYQSQLNEILLNDTEEIVVNAVSIDCLLEKIVLTCKELVAAERCSIFLVYEEKNKLYADNYFVGFSWKATEMFSIQKHILFSCDEGIVGHVYKTKQGVNIFDASRDKHFDPAIDEVNGNGTKTVLCMPIIMKERVIGVIQLINCITRDHFTPANEYSVKKYSVYCAMALEILSVHKKLCDINKKHKISMEVLYRQIAVPEHESVYLMENSLPAVPASFSLFEFNPLIYEDQLPQLFVYIMRDLFGNDVFDLAKLCRFVMTVRKNYRPLPYHNWVHGFEVVHTLYCIMKTNWSFCKLHEMMALIIAGLCHDLDHSGFNSIIFQEFNLPLADLYGTCVMEQQHYKITIAILQLQGHDIFSFLYSHEYKEMLLLIHDAIMATDLSFHFHTKNQILQLIENKTFDLHNARCRTLFKAILMTAADLGSVAKPWNTQLDMVSLLYQELYLLRDAGGIHADEKIDKELKDNIPKHQVNFILLVCKPLYTIIADILPGCKPLLRQVEINLRNWQKCAAEKIKKRPRSDNLEGMI